MARFNSIITFFLAVLSLSLAKDTIPKTDYDVIIVGGGPAGLSAMSALCRVSRRAVLFDTKYYRNNATRNMHDVIGNDGAPPADFRAAARAQIDKYNLGTFVNQMVEEIQHTEENGHHVFTAFDVTGKSYTARRVVLATGVLDVLPETPGVLDAYGKGMFWCPWCDGFEHRDQSLAVIGPLSDALSSVLEMHNMNPDTIVLTNGTDTPAERALASDRSATWEEQFRAYNVPIINNTIERIERLRDGGKACSSPHGQPAHSLNADPQIPIPSDAGPNGKHYDLFKVHFSSGLTLERAAFLVNIPVQQSATLPAKLNLDMKGPKVVVDSRLKTSYEGIFAIGDMNNEGSTNVPHAMYNGKKAGVVIHVQLAKEESLAAISKRSLSVINEISMEKLTFQKIGDELEKLWDNIKAQYAK